MVCADVSDVTDPMGIQAIWCKLAIEQLWCLVVHFIGWVTMLFLRKNNDNASHFHEMSGFVAPCLKTFFSKLGTHSAAAISMVSVTTDLCDAFDQLACLNAVFRACDVIIVTRQGYTKQRAKMTDAQMIVCLFHRLNQLSCLLSRMKKAAAFFSISLSLCACASCLRNS